MDIGDLRGGDGGGGGGGFDDDDYDLGNSPRTKKLPLDLPTSLDDRRATPHVFSETELYDGWQGV